MATLKDFVKREIEMRKEREALQAKLDELATERESNALQCWDMLGKGEATQIPITYQGRNVEITLQRKQRKNGEVGDLVYGFRWPGDRVVSVDNRLDFDS